MSLSHYGKKELQSSRFMLLSRTVKFVECYRTGGGKGYLSMGEYRIFAHL